MPEKKLKEPKNVNDTNEILLAINENLGRVTLELISEISKVKESNDEIVKLLKKKSR